MTTSHALRILIADDHAIFRQGLISTFERYLPHKVHCTAEAANGHEAIEQVESTAPQVVLMDVAMPELDGIGATMVVKRRFPQVSVVGLSYSDDSDTVLSMINAGCDGFLLKTTSADELSVALQTVSSGGTYFTPSILSLLSARMKQGHPAAERPLTAHELRILQMICEGKSSKEIAQALHISKRTVDTNREKIMRKAGVKNVLDLLRYAIKKKLFKI